LLVVSAVTLLLQLAIEVYDEDSGVKVGDAVYNAEKGRYFLKKQDGPASDGDQMED
jgi:hypothetical protein